MWKRLITSFLVVLTIISFSTLSYGSSITPKSDTMDTSKYKILNPEKTSFSTRNKVILVNGKAPKGTEITIDVYGTTDLTKKNFNLDKLPSEKDYINTLSESVKAGNMGFFQKEIDLILGINKIVVTFNVGDLEPVELIVYYYETTSGSKEVKFSEIVPKLN